MFFKNTCDISAPPQQHPCREKGNFKKLHFIFHVGVIVTFFGHTMKHFGKQLNPGATGNHGQS